MHFGFGAYDYDNRSAVCTCVRGATHWRAGGERQNVLRCLVVGGDFHHGDSRWFDDFYGEKQGRSVRILKF